MITIKKYTKENKQIWNAFLKDSKNGIFMFDRDFMEYHSDRFCDNSLMFYQDDKLMALLPANLQNDILYSHAGLSFGGFIINDDMRTPKMLEIFIALKEYCRANNINKIIYKSMPYIYFKKPCDEADYAIFLSNAKLIRRDISSTINLNYKFSYSKGRKWTINKAKRANLSLVQTSDFSEFWQILSDVLAKQHNTKPTHSLDEITNLYTRFPQNIKLFVANTNGEILAGAVIFETELVAHTQYLANSFKGREIGALDFLIDKLINEIYANKVYFDFGISNENNGLILNYGLIRQKEEFGARAVSHNFYEICTNEILGKWGGVEQFIILDKTLLPFKKVA